MKPHSFSYESMGTGWSVSIWDQIDSHSFNALKHEIITLSQRFDETYSRFIKTSLVSQLSQKTGIVSVPLDFIEILQLYFRLYNLSGKKFTPLIGSVLEDLGYDAQYSLKEKDTIHPVADLDKAVTILDDETIELHTPCLFDFGALGKGYFVEKIKSLLSIEGIRKFLVNGSGDIFYQGNGELISVGLEHPLDTSKVIGIIQLENGALCGSGSNRRSWGKHHHIIDPDSLTSTTEIIASWVMADSATIADGLATALFLVPPEYFQKEFKFEYLLLNKDMKVKRSKGFSAELY
ncbi:MAG TPA: FAD:protein FMN transferase [Candidatus Woesebacteria bacterium]|nr:FAD:protein FMN transferase [Candidatus Woesebacteria bacterium]